MHWQRARLQHLDLFALFAIALVPSCAPNPAGSCLVPHGNANIEVRETQIPGVAFSIGDPTSQLTLTLAGLVAKPEGDIALTLYASPVQTVTLLNVKLLDFQHIRSAQDLPIPDLSAGTLPLNGDLTQITLEIPLTDLRAAWPPLKVNGPLPRTGGLQLNFNDVLYQREFTRVEPETIRHQSWTEWTQSRKRIKQTDVSVGRGVLDLESRIERPSDLGPTEPLPLSVFVAKDSARFDKIQETVNSVWKDQCGIEIEFVSILGFPDDGIQTGQPLFMSLNEIRPEMAVFLSAMNLATSTIHALPVISDVILNNPKWKSPEAAKANGTTDSRDQKEGASPQTFLRGFTSRFGNCSLKALAPVFRGVLDRPVIFVDTISEPAILAHEIGHALGIIDHSENSKDLMYSQVARNIRITAEQCRTARAGLRRLFPNSL